MAGTYVVCITVNLARGYVLEPGKRWDVQLNLVLANELLGAAPKCLRRDGHCAKHSLTLARIGPRVASSGGDRDLPVAICGDDKPSWSAGRAT